MKKPRHLWLYISAVFVCLALLAGGVILLSNTPENPPAEVFVLQAEDLAAVFGSQVTDSAVTNRYSTVYRTPSNPAPVLYAEYLPMYTATKPSQEITKARLQGFIDKYLEAAVGFFDVPASSYEIKMGQYTNYEAEVGTDVRYIKFSAANNLLYTHFCTLAEKRLNINGSTVSIRTADTDGQIEDKLNSTAAHICKTFGKNYTLTKIHRQYSAAGISSISVYLYSREETGFPENFSTAPLAPDYIRLVFGSKTNDEVFLSDVQLCEAIGKWKDFYQTTAKAQMLTLEEAKELLEKGYVFGNHSCTLCMKKQPSVDFSDYTYVTIEYVFDADRYLNKKERPLFPFYVFYKHLEEKENGINSYARTYVPAIQVTGLDEYFEQQAALHK